MRIINKGISLIEVLIVISIISIIVAIAIPSFSSFKNNQILKNTTEDIISLLSEARNNTISSKNSMNYGVHFEEHRIVLFPGITYTESSSNKEIVFEDIITIPSQDGIALYGGGDDIIFNRITGDTSNYGTIKIQINNNLQKIINVNKIGVISLN